MSFLDEISSQPVCYANALYLLELIKLESNLLVLLLVLWINPITASKILFNFGYYSMKGIFTLFLAVHIPSLRICVPGYLYVQLCRFLRELCAWCNSWKSYVANYCVMSLMSFMINSLGTEFTRRPVRLF